VSRSRVLHWFGVLTAVIAVVGVSAFLAVIILVRTPWGMERARRVALSWLNGQVAGQITIQRVSGDGLLRMATLSGVEVREPDGRTLMSADSVAGRYDIVDLLRGRIVIARADIWGATANIERWPGESDWNYERVFRSSGNGDSVAGSKRFIRFDNVNVHGANVRVVRPIPAGESTSNLTSRFVTLEHPNGRVQVVRFDDLTARLPHITWSSPRNADHEIEIHALATVAHVFENPIRVNDVSGRVVLRDSIISLDVEEFRLERSRGGVSGRIVAGEAGTGYDLDINATDIDVSEFAWVDPRMPSTGHASFDLVLGSGADGTDLLFRRIDFTAPGTHVSGTFGFRSGSHPVLNGVDLDIESLDLAWAQTEFVDSVRVNGAVTGHVRAAGPLSAVRTSGDIRLATDGRAPADVQWSGTVRLDGLPAANGLRADVSAVDLALLDGFRPGLGLSGTVDGRVEVDGRLRDGMQLRAVLRHRLGASSSLDGGGTIRSIGDGLAFDLSFEASPLRLETVAAFVPGVDSLRGPATGRIAVAGTTDSLVVTGDVRTAGGPVAFESTIDRRGPEPRFGVHARSASFTPALVGLVAADGYLAGDVVANLTGNGVESLHGPIRVALDSAMVRGWPLERSQAAIALDMGRVIVDSADVRAPGMRVALEGAFGLVADRADSLRLIIDSESLDPLERILFDEIADPTQPRVAGRGRAIAWLFGNIRAFDATVDADVEDVLYDGRTVEAAHVTGAGTGLLTDSMRYRVAVQADSVNALDGRADSVFAELERDGASGAVRLTAWRDSLTSIRFAATFDRTGTGSVWNVSALGFESGPGRWTLASPAQVTVDGRVARIDTLKLLPSVGGEVVAAGALAWSDEAGGPADPALDFDLDMRRVPFGLVPVALRPAGDVRGAIDGRLHIGGVARSPTIDGTLDVTGVEYEGSGLERVEVRLRYTDLLLDATVSAFLDGTRVLEGSGTLPLDLRFGPSERRLLDRPITASLVMENFPAAFTLGFTSGFSNVEGAFQGSIEANGNARSPELTGALVLVGGAATWDATGVRYTNVEGTLLMNRELTAAVDFTARTVNPQTGERGGTARLRGDLDLAKPTDPGFDLHVVANRILASQRRDVEMTASGNVDIAGRYTRPEVSGAVTINGGTLYLDELYRQYLIVQLEDPLLFDVVDTTLTSGPRVLPKATSPFLRNLHIQDMDVTVAAGSWLRGREINVEVAGQLNVAYDRQGDESRVGGGDYLRMGGTLNVIRGTYRLDHATIKRSFDVQEGTVEFPGTPGIDPNLDITAVYAAPRTGDEPLNIIAQVTGTLQSPRVNLTSDAQPPISESDLASYLFLGAPTYAFNAASTGSVFGSVGRQVITNTSLGYFASGLQTLGQSFGLLDYVGLSAAETGTGSDSNPGLLSGTKIELGRYWTSRVFVTWVQRLNSTSNDPGFRLEWRFTDTFTMELFDLDRFARTPSFGVNRAIATRRERGFFLFREWGY